MRPDIETVHETEVEAEALVGVNLKAHIEKGDAADENERRVSFEITCLIMNMIEQQEKPHGETPFRIRRRT